MKYKAQKCIGIHPPLVSDQVAIRKTAWRNICTKLGLVQKSTMKADDIYAPGTKIVIKRKRHDFYRGLGIIMTKPKHKKAAFRVFMVDAAKNINVKVKDVKVPRGVMERMEREQFYNQTLVRQRNQDWFGLPIKRKVGSFKKMRYRASRALRIRSAKQEIQQYDKAAAENKGEMDFSNRLYAESKLYVAPIKTLSWEQSFQEIEMLRTVSEWEWLRDLATGKKYWINVKTDERRPFMPVEFVTWKDKLHYFTIHMLREQYRRYTITDYVISEADWFTVKTVQKVLTPEEVARKEAAKWKEGFDEEKQMPFWSRTVVVRPAFGGGDIDVEDLPTKIETVWEKPLELLSPEDRKKKIAETNAINLQKQADEQIRIENEQKQALRLKELERKKAKRGGRRGRGRGRR